MSLDPITLVANLGMALVTWLTRITGYTVMRRFNPGGRLRAAMEALPPAILTAIIAPYALTTGPAEVIASALTILTALRFPVLAAIVVGTGSVVVLRMFLG